MRVVLIRVREAPRQEIAVWQSQMVPVALWRLLLGAGDEAWSLDIGSGWQHCFFRRSEALDPVT